MTNFSQPLIGIKSYEPIETSTSFDGWIGFSPYTEHPEIKDMNFMVSLKNQGIIEHNVAAFTMPRNAPGVIQLGCFNPAVNMSDFTLFKSGSTSSWTLQAKLILLNDIDITLSDSRTLIIDPELPYIYMPVEDRKRIVLALKKQGLDVSCGSSCKVTSACDSSVDFSTLLDLVNEDNDKETTKTFSFTNKGGSKLIGSDCTLPFMTHTNDDSSWYLGSIFFDDYYLVLDMTPLDERDQSYIQIGLGTRNTSYDIIQANYNFTYPDHIWDFQVKFNDSSRRVENSAIVINKLPTPSLPTYPELNGTYTGPEDPFKEPEDAKRYNAGNLSSVYQAINGKAYLSWDMFYFFITHQIPILWQITIHLYPFTFPYLPPFFVITPTILGSIWESDPDSYTNPQDSTMKQITETTPMFGYALDFTWKLLTGDFDAIYPYDGKIRAEYFVYLQVFCVFEYFTNNFTILNWFPLMLWFWAADWSFTTVFNGPW